MTTIWFCTRCGARYADGVVHVCDEAQVPGKDQEIKANGEVVDHGPE